MQAVKVLITPVIFLYMVQCQEYERESRVLVEHSIVKLVKNLPKEFFVDILKQVQSGLENGQITANVSDFAGKVITNMNKFMIVHGLDPSRLPDEHLKLPVTGYINLTDGWLSDISSLHANGDVEVSYSSTTRTIQIDLPIKFDDLKFTYHYYTHVLLINIDGDLTGTVKKVKAYVVLSFNFEQMQANLDKIDIRDTGSIHIHFSGNGLVDWITNMLSEVVSLFLHPVIIEIAQGVVKKIMNGIIDTINQLLDDFLHPDYL